MPSEALSIMTVTPRTTRSARDFRIRSNSQHRTQSMSPKTTSASQSSAPIPLTPVDGNRRPKSGRAKPSRKEKENMAQAQEGITISDAESVDVMDILGSAEQIVQTRGKDAGQLQWLVEYLEGKFASMQQKLE